MGDLGIAGLALLRLHAVRDPSQADECLSEIRRILGDLDATEPVEERTPLVDVGSGYARWSQIYDRPGNPLVESEAPVVRAMLDTFEADPLLDAACGTGRHLAYLAHKGHRVIGVDVVPQMIDKAREKVPHADFRLGDLTALPVENGEVGGLVCGLALEHVDHLGIAYAEFARVVAPGGGVVISTMHPVLRSVFGWGAWFIDDQGKTDIPTFDHQLADHLNAAAAAGLVVRRCEEPIATSSALPSDASLATRIAYSGMPMILALQFERLHG